MYKKKAVTNRHHLQYADEEKGIPEIVVTVYKGEHQILTRLSWTKRAPSIPFVKEIRKWLEANECDAVDLDVTDDE